MSQSATQAKVDWSPIRQRMQAQPDQPLPVYPDGKPVHNWSAVIPITRGADR